MQSDVKLQEIDELLESELKCLMEEISLTEQSFQKQEIYRKENKQIRTVLDSAINNPEQAGRHNVDTSTQDISIYNEPISIQIDEHQLDLSEM